MGFKKNQGVKVYRTEVQKGATDKRLGTDGEFSLWGNPQELLIEFMAHFTHQRRIIMSEHKNIIKREEENMEKTHALPSVTLMVETFENDGEILLYADMPGVVKKDININMDNGKLFLTGVRCMDKFGVTNWEEFGDVKFTRTFSVPQRIDIAKVTAELTDGVLKLDLPKSEEANPGKLRSKVHDTHLIPSVGRPYLDTVLPSTKIESLCWFTGTFLFYLGNP